MRLATICSVVFALSVALTARVSAQRWIAYDPGTGNAAFYLVRWDSLVAVVIDHRNGDRIELHSVAGGKGRKLGIVPGNSSSATQIKALLAATTQRWVKAWPNLNGAYQKPASAEAFVDPLFAVSMLAITPIDVGGDAWRIAVPDGLAVAVADATERQRIQRLIDVSMRP
jgi:hypothetical protein